MNNTKNTIIKSDLVYKQWRVDVHLSKYSSNNRHSIFLVDHDDFQPVASATVNIVDQPLGEDEVFIKSYSENEGMFAFLYSNGIIGPVITNILIGFTSAQKCKLLITN